MRSRPWIRLGVVAALLVIVAPARARAQDSADSSAAGLAATSASPWNPPRAVPASEPWEAVVRFPGRLASLPLALLGQGTRVTLLAAEQGFVIQRVAYLFHGIKLPVSVGPASLGDRTGFGAELAISNPAGPLRFESLFDASTLGYTRTRIRAGTGPATVEYRQDLRPNERFFGLGLDAPESGESRYGLLQQRLLLGLELDRDRKRGGESFAAWSGPRWSRLTQGFGDGDDSTISQRFPALVLGSLDHDFEHWTYGARVGVDRRGGAPHWSHGWRASFEAERYDRPIVSSPSRTGAQFTRYGLLAEGGVSFWRDPRTLRLTFTATDIELGTHTANFLVSDLSRLGGRNGLAGYEPHRFHDVDVMNVRAAYIFPLSQHFEMDVHGDAGGVFADLQNDARPNRLKQSAGFALRGRTAASVVAMLGFDFSPEASRFVFSIGAEP